MARANKYDGTCHTCGIEVPAGLGVLGKRERGRSGRMWTPVYCGPCGDAPAGVDAAGDGELDGGDPDNAIPPAPSHVRFRDGRRSGVVRFSSGATFYRNVNGRCEDAPCCGCCSI